MNDVWERLDYFLGWNAFWGLMLGGYLGTTIFPVFGTLIGAGLGFGLGFICGIVCGAVAALVHPYLFNPESDAEAYGRSLSRIMGPVAGLVAGGLSLLIGLPLTAAMPTQYWSMVDYLVNGLPRALWIPTGLLAAITNVFIAHDFSLNLSELLSHPSSKPFDNALSSRHTLPLMQPYSVLWQHGMKHWRWITLLCAALALCLQVTILLRNVQIGAPLLNQIQAALAAGPAAAIAAVLVWSYGVGGNVMLLQFLKQTIYRRWFPSISDHWYRISLTGISFVFTCGLLWFTLIFAPVIAGITAYHVYHTLALPHDPYNKAKRKEKNTLALDEAIGEDVVYESLEQDHQQEAQA